jgi:DNA topoisomerase-3
LAVAQRLYEELKCISYPRTDAQHLSEENKELVKEVLRKLGREDLIESVDKVGKRVFDDSKLTDHHAIIPLDRLPKSANEDDKKLYELIKNRFFAVFMPAFEYLSFKVITKLGKYEFVSYGRKILALGWRKVEPLEETQPDLSFLRKGDRVKKEKVLAQKKFTEPPPAYTEGSLLKEMERLSLGTPATRASIIETLKERGYVFLKGKSLIATEKGKALIKFLEGRKIVQPEMTSEWEKKLESIYTQKQGKRGYEEFLEGIKTSSKKNSSCICPKTFTCPQKSQNPKKQASLNAEKPTNKERVN